MTSDRKKSITISKINWRAILWGLIPIVVIAIVFAIPVKTVAVETTETYWDTEMKSEPYDATEEYTGTESYIVTEVQKEIIYNSYIYPGKEQTFEIDKPGSAVTVSVQGYPYYSYSYSSPYVIYDDGDPHYYLWPSQPWGGQGKIKIELSYPEDVVKERTVTKVRNVVKYREVPVQVQKEKSVTEYKKMSIWGYLFT